MKDKLKEAGKKVIGYPDPYIPTVSSKDWLLDILPNPKQQVIHSYPVTQLAVIHSPRMLDN